MSAALEAPVETKSILPDKELRPLTARQKAFVDFWLEHRNGRLAASLAGYSGGDDALRSIASDTLTKPNVQAYISQRLKERHLTADQVLAELGDIAGYSLDSIAIEGSPVKTWDKLKALELVGKYHKLFTDRVEIDQPADSKQLASEIVAALLELRQQASASMDQPGHVDQPCQPQLGVAQDIAVELPTDNKE